MKTPVDHGGGFAEGRALPLHGDLFAGVGIEMKRVEVQAMWDALKQIQGYCAKSAVRRIRPSETVGPYS